MQIQPFPSGIPWQAAILVPQNSIETVWAINAREKHSRNCIISNHSLFG